MSTRNIVKNIRSNSVGANGKPKLPSPNQLDYGEIAVNYASGHETLSLKNDAGNIVSLSVNSVEDVKVNGSTVVSKSNKTAEITMKGNTIPVSGEQYSPMIYPKPFDGKAQQILATDMMDDALKTLETNISALVTEVLDNEETSAAAIRKLAESAGTVDGSGNISYQKAAGAHYISNAGSVHNATVILDSKINTLQETINNLQSTIDNLQGSIGQSSIEWVDLGLPSGTYWAKCNVGAFTETENGDYFMWGSTTPDNNHACNWENTPFNNGLNEFNYTYFTDDVKNILCPKNVLAKEFDAAYKATNGIARMPTYDELEELTNTNNTTQEFTNIKGVYGYKFTSKRYSSRYIFIPAAGLRSGSSFSGQGNDCHIWSSSLYISDDLSDSYHWGGSAGLSLFQPNMARYFAFPVRSVKNA